VVLQSVQSEPCWELGKEITTGDSSCKRRLRCAVARRVAFREIIEETGGGQGCPVLRNLKIPCMSMSWEFPELKQIDFSNEKIILPPRFSQEFLVNPNVSREIRSSSTSYFVYVLEGRYILYLYVIMNITTYEKE